MRSTRGTFCNFRIKSSSRNRASMRDSSCIIFFGKIIRWRNYLEYIAESGSGKSACDLTDTG